MKKEKLNSYRVAWSERHSVIVKAPNEGEAIKKASKGNYDSDENAEITESGFEVWKICEICGLPEDEDGRCRCTNKDALP